MSTKENQVGSVPIKIRVETLETEEEIFEMEVIDGLPIYADMSQAPDIKATLGDEPAHLIAAELFERVAGEMREGDFEQKGDLQ